MKIKTLLKDASSFLKQNYKYLTVVILPILFLVFYNHYLMDRSLYNLRFALAKLEKLNVEEQFKVKNLVGIIDSLLLQELSSEDVAVGTISDAEIVKDFLNTPQNSIQLEEAKLALKRMVEQRQGKRPAILNWMDQVSTFFSFAPGEVAATSLNAQIRSILKRISVAVDDKEKQNLYYKLGQFLLRSKDLAKAQEAFRVAIDLGSEEAIAQKARFNLAWILKQQNRFAEAMAEFAQIIQNGRDKNLVMLSILQQADIYRKKGEFEKAITLYQDMLKLSKDDDDLKMIAELRMSQVYLYDLKDANKAKSILERSELIKKDPELIDQAQKKFNLALGLDLRRRGFALLKEGLELKMDSKFKEALAKLDEALNFLPQDGLVYLGKAIALYLIEEKALASFLAKEAVRLSSKEEIVSLNAGYLFLNLGLIDEAINEYRRFVKEASNSAKIQYNLGFAYLLSGKLKEAQEAFKKAIELDPKFYQAYNNLGWCFWQNRQYSQALQAFEEAVKINPNFCDSLYNLGVVYRSIGRLKEAKIKFVHIIKVNPNYSKAFEQLREIETLIRKQEFSVLEKERSQ